MNLTQMDMAVDMLMTMNLYYHLTDDKKAKEMNFIDYAF
mgnify:CR=1 FL=1